MATSATPKPVTKSKTWATWIAIVGGSLGWHRFYLHGFRDIPGWLHPAPTLIGLYGVMRMRSLGQDDQLAWTLIPLLGCTISAAMLAAIVYGLTSDEKWNARFNPTASSDSAAGQTQWVTIGAVVASLLIGATVLMSSIVFSFQHYFEFQIEEARKISQ
jgi:hypothetical protein